MIGLTKSLAVELGRTGVTVNCICPGPIRTGMTAGIPEDAKETYARPQGAAPSLRRARGGRPRHAELRAAGLSFMNGAVLVVDGGMTIRHT